MALPILPILAGVAVLALSRGKKRRKKTSTNGTEPDTAPGGGYAPPENGGENGRLTIHGHTISRPLAWNATIAAQAREVMEEIWAKSSKNLSGAMHFMLMRDTAMALWPQIRWPKTTSEALRQISLPPGRLVPVWIYNLGDRGEAAERIWINLRGMAWEITGFKMPV